MIGDCVMRAWNVPRAGAEVWLSDLPVPEVTEGTMLVRVRAAALNAIDSALAARTMAQMIPHRYPLVLAVTPPGPSRR
jgi:NADPH:quinone reductase-like Zn-dependent oxidoreductase